MKLLVDTHAMLWFVSGDDRLSIKARQTIETDDCTCYISMASWWEMAIKCSLGKLQLSKPIDAFMTDRTEEGFRVLAIDTQHLAPVVHLPFHHRDPIDRLIIAQAICEKIPICTADPHFTAYDIPIIW